MNKSRPEIINLNTPTIYADKFEALLLEELAKTAKLKRVDIDGKTKFSFYPTKSEYFLISLKISFLAEELGGVQQ
jgi:hypothetical protein